MNYLAHAYLSFEHPEILVGNMISDDVKGRKQYDYPTGIQLGIRLHREIDNYTDRHPVTRDAKQWLKPAVGAYAGAFIDVVYDHFLALDPAEMEPGSWDIFTREVYRQLADRQEWLPAGFARMLPYMTTQNWLYNYRFTWGIEKSFQGIARKASNPVNAAAAFELFHKHYPTLEEAYGQFFPDVKKFAYEYLTTLLKP